MAFEPNIETSISLDNKILAVIDTSGIYNATFKPTGYQAPNLAKADVDTAELILVYPDASIVTVTPADVVSAIVNSGVNTPNFYLTRIINTTGFDDGKYEVTYGLGDGSIQYQTVDTFYNYASLRACLIDKWQNLETCNTCKKDDYLFYESLYKSMQYTFLKGDYVKGELLYNQINKWACSSC